MYSIELYSNNHTYEGHHNLGLYLDSPGPGVAKLKVCPFSKIWALSITCTCRVSQEFIRDFVALAKDLFSRVNLHRI